MKSICSVFLLIACGLASAFPARAADTATTPDDMILVPEGAFIRGSNRKDHRAVLENDAGPQTSVTLPAFFIDKTEVTNGEYKKYCDATHYPTPVHWKNGTFASGQADFPVTRINWYEAAAYARWKKKRLPTEAEWEKAARGTDGRVFPWGNDWDENRVAWNGLAPEAVGSHPSGASPFGALDMAGNVYEWTADWYGPYPNGPLNGNTYFGKTYKVIRGGAFSGIDFIAMTWFRSIMPPTSRSEWIGFRCARDAP